MPKGTPWTLDEEKHLSILRDEGKTVVDIALLLEKSEQAVMKKLQRMGLKVVQLQKTSGTTTSSEVIMPKELPSVEEALKLLAGAMKALETPELSRTEVLRLRCLIQAATVYQTKIAEYMDYRRLESELLDWKGKYAQLAKKDAGTASALSPTSKSKDIEN